MMEILTISRVSQALGVLCFVFLAICAPFADSRAYVDFAAGIYLIGAGLTFLSSSTSTTRAGVDYLFSFFFFLYIALPAWAQIEVWLFPWQAHLSPAHVSLTFGLLSLFQLCYLAGMLWARRNWPRRRNRMREISVGDAVFYSRWAWGLALFALMLAALVGPSHLLSSRFGSGRAIGGIIEQSLLISRSVSILSLIIMICMARWAPTVRIRQQNLIVLVMFLPAFLVINYIPALPRFQLFGMLLALLCPFVNYHKPLVKIPMAAVAFFVLFVVFPVAKVIAYADAGVMDLVGMIGRVRISSALLGVDFDSFMQLVSIVQYLLTSPDAGLRWGNNFLGVVLFFVPRALWPGKPTDSGVMVSEGLGYWYNNVSSPLPGEALLAFGLLGPVLVGIFAGYIISNIENMAGRGRAHSGGMPQIFLYAITMGFIFIILRGALNAVAPQFASAFLFYVVMRMARQQRIVWQAPKRADRLAYPAGPS